MPTGGVWRYLSGVLPGETTWEPNDTWLTPGTWESASDNNEREPEMPEQPETIEDPPTIRVGNTSRYEGAISEDDAQSFVRIRRAAGLFPYDYLETELQDGRCTNEIVDEMGRRTIGLFNFYGLDVSPLLTRVMGLITGSILEKTAYRARRAERGMRHHRDNYREEIQRVDQEVLGLRERLDCLEAERAKLNRLADAAEKWRTAESPGRKVEAFDEIVTRVGIARPRGEVPTEGVTVRPIDEVLPF